MSIYDYIPLFIKANQNTDAQNCLSLYVSNHETNVSKHGIFVLNCKTNILQFKI